MAGLGTGAPIVQVYHEKSIILPDVSRVLACLYEKDIKFKTHTASYRSLLRLQASSHAPVPFYDGPTFLEDSREICRYIAETYEDRGYPFLLGKDALERASVEQWLHNEEHAFNPPSRALLSRALLCHLAFPLEEDDGDDIEMNTRKLEEVLDVYEQRLGDNEFLAGNKFTLADLVHLPNSHYITSGKFLYLYDSRKNVRRWWDSISIRPSWQQVLRDMKMVEEQHKQEELEKHQQLQHQQIEHRTTSGHPIRLDPRKQIGTEPRTLLFPPAHIVLSSPTFSKTEEPPPTDTFPNEDLVSSSQSTTSDKTSSVQSKETTIFTTPQETTPTSVQSTPTTPKKSPIPVQSLSTFLAPVTSPTAAEKPPIVDAAKSTEMDLRTRHKPGSPRDVSNNLDVFDYYNTSSLTEEGGATSPIQKRQANIEDTTGQSRDVAFKPKQMIGQDDQDNFKETKAGDPSLLQEQSQEQAQIIPAGEKAEGSTTKHQRASDALDEKSSTTARARAKTRDDFGEEESYKEDTTDDQKVVPPLLSTEPTSRVQPLSESLQEASPHGSLSAKPSTIHQWQRASASLNDATTSSGDDEIGMPTIDKKLTPMSQQGTFSAEGANQMAEDSDEKSLEPPVPTEAETSGVQRASPSFPGASTAHHATIDDKFAKQSIIEDARDKGRKSSETIPERQKMVETKTGASGEQPSDRLKATSPSRQEAAEHARDATGDTIWPPDIVDTSMKSRGTFEEAKGPSSTLPKAQSLGAQDTDVNRTGLGSLSSEGKDAEATMGEVQSFSTQQLGEMLKKSESTIPKAQPTDFQGPIKEEKASSIYQKKPLVAQDSREQAQTIPAGEKADGSTPKHQQASDALYTFDEKSSASAPARAKSQDDHSAEEPYRKDTTNDQKVAPPILSKEPNSRVQPSSEPSQDTAPHGDLHSKPSTIDQWQRASAPLHDVATSSGDNEMAMSAIDQKPTPRSQQETFSADFTNQMAKESGNQRVEPLMPIGAETSDVKRPSPSFPTASIADDANIDDKLAKQSITDERAREPIQMQAPSPDAHPASAPGKRATPEGHEIGGQMSEVTKASDDLATVHEDIYDTNLSTHDLAKDTFKETKVAESTPSSAKPIYTQQPATASRLAEVEEARDKGRQSRETIPEQQNMVERKSGVSEEQSSDHLKAIRPSRLAESEDARGATGDTIQSPDILDTTKKSRGTFEEIKGPGSTLPKAQSLGAQGAQRTSVESTTPTADQRKDISTKPQSNVQDVFQQSKLSSTDQKGSEGKDAEAIMTEEKSFSTERPRGMLKENELTIPKAQPTDSQGSITEEETSSVYQKRPLATQDSGKQSQIIPVGADGSTLKPQQASDAPYTFDEKSSASAPARADIHDDDSAEEPYKKDTTDDQKVAPPLLSKEPSQDAAPHGDLSSKPSTVDQWQRASAPLHGASTNSGDTEMATPSTIDQKPTPMSQEATLSSQSVNQVAGQSGEQRVEPPVPIKTETSDLPRAAPSFPEAATADNVTIDNKFAKQPTIDERLGEPKQMQAPITDAHPAPAPTKRTTPDGHETGDLELAGTSEGQRLEAAKAIQDPATIHDDAHDANLSTHYAAIGEKAATYRASGDQLVTGSLHDQQALPPALTQAQPPVDTPHDSASSQYVHTDALGKTELAKPTETDQEATTPIAGPTSREPQLGSTLPAEVALAEQKSALSEQESTRAAQPFSPVEPVKMDSNISAADYTNAPQIIFQQQARPSAPSTREVPASDAQGVVRKIQEVTPSDHHTDDSGRPLVPSQEQVSQASQAIPGREDITSSPGARDYPTSDTQLALGKVHELSPDSHVGSAFGPGEVGPAEKKFAPSDQDLAHSAEQPLSGEPRKEQTVVPSAEQIKALPTVIGQQGTPDTREGLTSEDSRVTIPTHGDVHPTSSIDAAGRPLSVQGEEVETQHGAAPDQIAFDEQKFASSGQGSADTAYPASAPDTQHGTALDKVAVNQQKFSPSGQDSVHSVQPSSSTEPTKENTAIGATDQTSTPQQIIDQKDTVPAPDKAKTPFSGTHDASRKMQRSTDDDLIDESLPNQGQVSPDKHASEPREGHTTDSYRTNVDEKTTTSSSSQLFSSEAGSDSIPTRRDVRPSMGGEPTEPFPPGHEPQSLAATQDVSLDALGKSKSTGPEAMAPTLDLASVPHTQHGSPQREAAPAEQKFAASDEESSHVSEPASSAEPRKGETNVAAADQPNVPQPIVSNQVTALTPDAREALLKDQEPPRGDDYTSNLASPLTVSQEQASDEGSTPEVHSNLADKKTTLPSSEAQTSNAGPDSAPTGADAHLSSGDVPATSSLPATRVPTIQDLQGSASAQDVPTDSSGKVKSPRQISIDQVMAPIMSPSVPSAAPLGTAPGTNSVQHPRQAPMAPIVDMASVPDTQHGIPQGETSPAEQKFAVSDQESPHTLEPPSSAEPRKVETNAAAADQPNVPQDPQTTIDHQVKAPELDAREALRKDELPSHHDDHISNLADSPIAGEEQSSPAGHASELRGRPTPEMRSAGVEKKTLPSSRAQTSDTGTDSTHISSDANLSSGDLPATSYLQNQEAQPPVETQEPTIQALQGSASTQNIFLRKIESQRQPSTDQVMASSAAPSDAPQGTEPGANLVQPPQQASMAPMVDLASTPDTQHDIPQGEAAPVEQKIAVFDQESVHTSEPPSSAEPRKEESNAVAADQLNVPQGLQTTIGHQVEAPAPDARDALQKDQQPSHDDDDVSNLANPLIASQEQTPAGRASELHDGPISGIRSAVVDRKTAPPSSQAHTSDTRLDSTPTSVDAHLSRSDVPATSYSQNQEAHAPVAIQAPTNQSLQGSASAQNISLGKIESPRQPSTDQVMASSAASSDAPQGTEPGKNSVRPPQEASIDLPSDEKTSTTQGDQVKTLLNGDLSTSEAVWQSESAVSKGNFQKNLEGASTDEKSKAQKQTDQSGTQSSKGRNKEANGAVRPNISTTFGEPPKQPSWPEETMESSEEPERQQQADQAIVQSLQGNNKEVEETKSQDIGTDEPKERESPENTNQKNNRISQVEASDHSGKEALGVQLLGKNTKGASNSPEDALGDNGTLNKSEGSLGSSEESKVQQTEGKTQVGETEAPSSESEQPKERGLPENNYQINSSQSQAEASDKSIGQSPPGIQNKNKNSSRLDGPTDATNSGDMEDDSQ